MLCSMSASYCEFKELKLVEAKYDHEDCVFTKSKPKLKKDIPSVVAPEMPRMFFLFFKALKSKPVSERMLFALRKRDG